MLESSGSLDTFARQPEFRYIPNERQLRSSSEITPVNCLIYRYVLTAGENFWISSINSSATKNTSVKHNESAWHQFNLTGAACHVEANLASRLSERCNRI